MSELRWYQAIPPRDVDLAAVVAVVRTLAHRPRYGLTTRPALVVFELWGDNRDGAAQIDWRLGVDRRAARGVIQAMRSQLPKLGLIPAPKSKRPKLLLAADLRLNGLVHPLRTDTAEAVASDVQSTLQHLGKGEIAVVQWLVGPGKDRNQQPVPFRLGEVLGLQAKSQPDPATRRSWREKAAEPLFGCRGRIAAGAGTADAAWSVIGRLYGGLQLANGRHASLRINSVGKPLAGAVAEPGMPLSWSCVLSASELAALLCWPVQEEIPNNLPVVGGHISLAPTDLLISESQAKSHGHVRIIGQSLHPAQRRQLVSLPTSSATHHVQVIGPTGSGKSTLLAGLITADIAAGRGVLVIEPRGDLIEDVLARVPKDRLEDVVVLDPAEAEQVVGLNVLDGPLETAERRADELVGLLAAMHGANWGPRTADIALHVILTASRLPDGTLCDVPALLNNPAFRRQVLAKVADPLVLGPWWAWYDSLQEAGRSQMVAPLMNKLRPFMSRDALRRMVGQSEPRFSFDDLFLGQRIVLVNLNRGLLGGPTANLLGALILSSVWAALQRRASQPREQRQMVGLYVDEFQDYVDVIGGLDFGDALAQSRGLGGAWTVAHQHLGQLSSKLEAAVIANARSRIVFHPATDDARPLAAALGGDLTGDDLLRLRAFQTCCQLLVDGTPSLPFSVQTLPLKGWISDPSELRRVSAQRYGVDGKTIDEALTKRWQGHGDEPQGRIGVRPRGKRS